MEIVSDLHLHSRFSRAVSQQMNLSTMAKYAKKKGIQLLTTSDWTHPIWFREIKAQLEETEEGVYQLKVSKGDAEVSSVRQAQDEEVSKGEPKFILTTEISSIYTQDGKLRRIHNLLFAPSLEIADKINSEFIKRGCNISSDGRPIVGLSSRQVLELALNIDKRVILIPCHAWTPHFGIYGSASGFDSIEEAFGDLSKYIYAIETGISSDPFMNWQIPELDKRAIVSFSDAHSPAKMGRELTVFNLPGKFSYMDIGKAIARPNDVCSIAYTIEFYPEEGKYHYSGHRNCNVSFSPDEVKNKGNICPVCQRRLTEGVMFRVQQVAGREISTSEPKLQFDGSGVGWIEDPKNIHPKFVKLVPLLEIVAESLESTVQAERVKVLFNNLCDELGPEIDVLLKIPIDEIKKAGGPRVAQGVEKVRKGEIAIEPGFDGEYGKVKIWPSFAKASEGKADEKVDVQEDNNSAQIQFAQKEEKKQLGLF